MASARRTDITPKSTCVVNVHAESARLGERPEVLGLAEPPVQLDVAETSVVVPPHESGGARGVVDDRVTGEWHSALFVRHEGPATGHEIRCVG
jgi:hypothetical protein